jgi:hypothetical protein
VAWPCRVMRTSRRGGGWVGVNPVSLNDHRRRGR